MDEGSIPSSSTKFMLSREFLIQRGYCCGHGCLMCPYTPKHTKGNTKLDAKNKKNIRKKNKKV